jgi:membrane protein YqaA with SNARE-associated domain
VRWFARPLTITGDVPAEPVVFAANHASHADTAVLLRALPAQVRARTAPAAAEDYFFRSRLRGALTRLIVGAFPFPRRGSGGLDRARALLADGTSVLLFPEGTRSRDGSIAPFKRGIGVLAREGFTVVPVGIAGTGDVFAKGTHLPRRAPVAVVFGTPLRVQGADPAGATAIVERGVRAAHARAELVRRPRIPTWFERAHRFAGSRAALWVCFVWGIAEALVLPVVPDVPVALLSLVAPRRFLLFVGSALAGTVLGGSIAYALGPPLLAHAPLVTSRMVEATHGWLADEGARAVWHQPFSGVPFKTFALQASSFTDPASFLGVTVLARGARFAGVAAIFAVAGRIARRPLRHCYGPFVAAFAVVFTSSLLRVVASWS